MATTTAAQLDLREIASNVVALAMKQGATAAECVMRDGTEFSTVVRLGEVETLKESGARALGVRVFFGKRAASTLTSDLSQQGIEQMVRSACDLAKLTSEDPYAGIPDAAQLGQISTDLDLYYNDVYSLSNADRIDYARRAEKAAISADPRIKNSEGGSFDAAIGRKVLANSHGFIGEYQRSYVSVSAVPIAQDENGNMQRDYWYSVSRTMTKLDPPEEVGRIAAERTLRRLGARKVKTQRVPLIFDRQTARALLDHIADSVNGDAIYRHASFLSDKLGHQVAGKNITVIDDGTMVGGYGSSPFDSEGVPTRRTTVIEKGELKNYLLNSYTARKLNLQTTGNASRALAGTPGISNGNFYLEPGTRTPDQMIADVKQGLYVTEFLGFGVNLVTGDFSRGASGLWIENGELTYPVEEITVAGNLKDMLNNISEIGSDLEWRSSVACPTIRIDGMTIAGE